MTRIPRIAGVGFFLLGSVLAISALAGGTEERRFSLPGHGTLQLQVPSGWKDEIRRPSQGLPPTVVFSPKAGTPFMILLTPLWARGPDRPLPGAAAMRDSVQRQMQQVKPHAVESDIPVQELRGNSGVGYYFAATDRAPKPGEYKYMTQGQLALDPLRVTFTILTNDGQRQVVTDALAMLAGASHTAEPARPPAGLPDADGHFRLTMPGQAWVLQFPVQGYQLDELRHPPDVRGRYYLFRAPKGRPVVSAWFEAADRCTTPPSCREQAWSNRAPSLATAQVLARFNQNGFAVLEYLLAEFEGRRLDQYHWSAHLVRDGCWVDLHLSKMGYRAPDRAFFVEFVDHLRIVPSQK